MHIAHELGIPVIEQVIPREMLYICDELFFSGTAAEITPIRSVDKIVVGHGLAGPITKSIRKQFYGIVNGTAEDRFGWLTPVPVPVPAKQPVSVTV
jgi:branched-chain amino acid aminotransferase